ncbi:MAG: short-chain fatty acyl-CoA regulator family protein [Pseudomonadota bacterium]
MARTPQGGIVGARIRARRRELGLTQAELARRVGISPSYLNLIERNKRAIAGRLLSDIAAEIGIRREELDGETERRLAAELAEVAADPRLTGAAMAAADAGEIIGRFPGWARALVMLARSERELSTVTRALSDRLTHDPFLSDAVHSMLTHTSALRAASEILRDVEDIDAADRARFVEIMAEESGRLSEVGTALAGYFDQADAARQAVGPEDEVEALFANRDNHFAELEEATSAGHDTAPVIEAILDAAPMIGSQPARRAGAARLARYAADAGCAPLDALLEAAIASRYDAEIVAARLGAPVEVVFRRFACLPAPEPGRRSPRFGYIETNAAGVATEFYGMPGLTPPRASMACPLWLHYRSTAQPGQILRQRAMFPTDLAFVFVARSRTVKAPGFGAVAVPVSDLLVLMPQDAALTVYGDGIESLPQEPVGQSCRICPRKDCTHRTVPAFEA